MTTIERTVTIDAPTSEVWRALADFGNIAVWNPNVKSSHLTSTRAEGTGISRECRLSPLGTVQERVTGWETERSIVVEIVEFKGIPAMRRAVATFTIEPVGERTEARLEMTYEVGLGALGSGMNAVMLRRQFGSVSTKMLAGLKLHVETGHLPVESGAKLPVAAVSG